MTRIVSIFCLIGAVFLAACASLDESGDETAAEFPVRLHVDLCKPHKLMTRFLFSRYRQTLRHTATAKATPEVGIVILFYVSDNESWTVVMAGPNGISCMALWGNSWRTERLNGSGQKI